jgi:hypothetical protein
VRLVTLRNIYSSVRNRAAGFVTFTPSTFALKMQDQIGTGKLDAFTITDDLPFENCHAIPAAHTVCDFRCEAFVVHQEQIDFPYIMDQEFLETVWK